MPLKLRFLRNFIRILNSNLTNLSTTSIMAYIIFLVLKRICHLVFILLNFLILIQNIANIFLFNYITKNDTKTKFKNGISDHFTLLKFYNIYCKSLDFQDNIN